MSDEKVGQETAQPTNTSGDGVAEGVAETVDAAALEPEISPASDVSDTSASTGQPTQGGQEGVAEAASASLDEMIALRARLESAESQLAQQKDDVLRAQAEAQNTRRRAEKDVESAHKFALEKFVNELIPVVDSLERGLESVSADDPAQQASREGLSLTLKMFMDALGKFSVEQVDPQGETFDPQLHQAMSMQESDDMEPNTVVAVMQKGYTLSDRLVRPAMVMVSKAPAAAAQPNLDLKA